MKDFVSLEADEMFQIFVPDDRLDFLISVGDHVTNTAREWGAFYCALTRMRSVLCALTCTY